MLRHLHLQSFAVVDAAGLALDAGMTAISGETGAGKSLLVDALLLLTGARSEAQMVRHGAQRAEIAAEFDLTDAPAAADWLRDNDLDDPDEPGVCRLRRTIRADGGSRAFINGRAASLSQLTELGERLVEIHGQHEHQALLSRPAQMDLLDAFGGHLPLVAQVRRLAVDWRDLARQIAAHGDPAAVAERCAWLERELTRLDRHALAPADIDALLASHHRQTHAAQLLEGSAQLLARLNADDGPAIEAALAQVRGDLARLGEHDPAYAQAGELVEAAAIQLAEASALIERARDGIDLDPERLRELEAELSALHELSRRHKTPLEGLAALRDELAGERERLRDADGVAGRLLAQRDTAAAAWRAAAASLASARTQTATRLATQVSGLMGELGMAGGRFAVELAATASGEPTPTGTEQAEFLVAANPGQPPRPLRKVASGGELSRIALAIEVAALGHDAVPTMVFDEVDTGIGGAIAEVVGRKLRTLGARAQVLCVTHLPQVAAQAHHHLRVSKDSDGHTTRSAVVALDGQARMEEIARMLGGIDITAETRAHAGKMLETGSRDVEG
ncbi:MAG: DNA repair protein RecN [Proteobacteria bacterium]|nr:DNA repair protein RecN [Pseudomonadota bacterium]MBS0463256.1 DNA repair protein RecN [Pseudomonadota bacterium]MBS0463855.1 DNA repair protein RecN [Pseudomonadota bacterium]